MQKLDLRLNWQLFAKRLFKYLVVLLLFLSLLIPILTLSYRLARESAMSQAQTRFDDGASRLARQIKRCYHIVTLLQDEFEYTRLLLLTGEPKAAYYVDINTLQRRLATLIQDEDYLRGAYLTFRNNSVFISNVLSSDDHARIYPEFFAYEGVTREAWLDTIYGETYADRFIGESQVFIGPGIGPNSRVITLLINASPYKTVNHSATLSCMLDANAIVESLIVPDLMAEGFILLRAAQGQTVLSHGYDDATDLTQYIVLETTLQSIGIDISAGIPKAALQRSLWTLLGVVLVYSIIGFIAIVLIALAFSYKDAVAMNNVLGQLSGSPGNLLTRQGEYRYIENVIRSMSSENQASMQKIMYLNQSMQACILDSLFVRGVYTRKDEWEALRYFDDDFHCYCVVKCQVQASSGEDRIVSQCLLALEGALAGALRTRYITLPQSPTELVLLIFFEDAQAAHYSSVQQAFQTALIEADNKTEKQFHYHIGISRLHDGVRHVREAYLESQQAVYIGRQDGENGVHRYDLLNEQNEASGSFDMAILIQLNEVILSGDLSHARQIFALIEEFVTQRCGDENQALQVFFSTRQVLDNVHRELAARSRISNTPLDITLPEYDPAVSVLQNLPELDAAMAQLCSAVVQGNRSNNERLRQDILLFIQENVTNPDLNAEGIAEAMSISVKYTFAFVKEHTGKSLGKYIEDLRMDIAEDLLRNTDLPVRKISEDAGFGSEKTFYRIFNKKHAVSPTKWRQLFSNITP